MKKHCIFFLAILFSTFVSCTKKEVREVKNPISGQLLEQFEVSENKEGSFLKDGFYKTWYANGQIECEGEYKQNKKTKTWSYWYENGQKKSEYAFINDSLNGLFTKWHTNGQKKIEGKYDNGKLVGEWNSWYDNGQLRYKELFENDKKIGQHTAWYKNGQMLSQGNYKNGLKEDIWNYWDQDGVLTKQEKYKNGKNITLVGNKWNDKDNDKWEFFEDNTYIMTAKNGNRKKGNWEIDENKIYLDGKALKIKYLSIDSVFATRWVSSLVTGSYEAQRLQAKRIKDNL
jgi:antitoxin component YwqK of YwqJK toxin-antitoxin module